LYDGNVAVVILGQRVIITNDRGGRFYGLCTTLTLYGEAVVEVDAVDIGYGRRSVPVEERRFPIEWVEVGDAEQP
jgi:hypothetical protein